MTFLFTQLKNIGISLITLSWTTPLLSNTHGSQGNDTVAEDVGAIYLLRGMALLGLRLILHWLKRLKDLVGYCTVKKVVEFGNGIYFVVADPLGLWRSPQCIVDDHPVPVFQIEISVEVESEHRKRPHTKREHKTKELHVWILNA